MGIELRASLKGLKSPLNPREAVVATEAKLRARPQDSGMTIGPYRNSASSCLKLAVSRSASASRRKIPPNSR